MTTGRAIGTALMLASGLWTTASASGQTVPWNRKIEGVSVLPAGGGGHDVRVFLGIETDGLTAAMDLSTEVLLMINGSMVDIQSVDVDVNPGCGTQCLANQACICCEISPGNSICSCGALVAELPSQASLQPEDEIMVLLRPAPGAVPEVDESDDLKILNYHGDPVYWNRAIRNVEVQPAAGAPDVFFDVFVEIEVDGNYDGVLSLGAELELQINGIAVATSPVPALDWDFAWNQCSGLPCDDSVACVMDPAGPYYGTCQPDEDGPFDCSCQYHPVPDEQASFLAIPLDDDDEVVVVLRPVPGALPELPGFGDDDEAGIPPECPGDLNGDTIIDAGDLAMLLGAWGPNAGHPADLNGDNVVNAADLAQLLGNWGHCFPV